MKILTPTFLLCLVALACTDIQAKGVAAVKTYDHQDDASANVFVFEAVRDTGAVIVFDIKGRAKPYSVVRSGKVEYVEVIDDLDGDITNDERIAEFRQSLKQSEAFANKYSRTRKVLSPYIEVLAGAVEKYDAGMVRRDGKWLKRQAFLREEAEAEALSKSREEDLIQSKIDDLKDKIEESREAIEEMEKEVHIRHGRRLYKKLEHWWLNKGDDPLSPEEAEENPEEDPAAERAKFASQIREKLVEHESLEKELARQQTRLKKLKRANELEVLEKELEKKRQQGQDAPKSANDSP